MGRKREFALLVVGALAFVQSPLYGQAPTVLRIEAVGAHTAVLDSEPIPLIGEYYEVAEGRHLLELTGPHSSTLAVEFVVTGSSVRIASRRLGRACVGIDEVQDFRVSSWPVRVTRTPAAPDVPVLLVDGPRIEPAADRLPVCPVACCGWDDYENWNLTISSNPKGAGIYVQGSYVASTDTAISVVYGVMRSGAAQNKVIRAVKTKFIGCQWSLQELRATGTHHVTCTLKSPPQRG